MKSSQNTFYCLGTGNLSQVWLFLLLFLFKSRKGGESVLPPSEIIGFSWNFVVFLWYSKSLGIAWVETELGLQEQCVGYIIIMIPLVTIALQESR